MDRDWLEEFIKDHLLVTLKELRDCVNELEKETAKLKVQLRILYVLIGALVLHVVKGYLVN